jgi:hypothetical protein
MDELQMEGIDAFATAGGANKAVDLVYNNIAPNGLARLPFLPARGPTSNGLHHGFRMTAGHCISLELDGDYTVLKRSSLQSRSAAN